MQILWTGLSCAPTVNNNFKPYVGMLHTADTIAMSATKHFRVHMLGVVADCHRTKGSIVMYSVIMAEHQFVEDTMLLFHYSVPSHFANKYVMIIKI